MFLFSLVPASGFGVLPVPASLDLPCPPCAWEGAQPAADAGALSAHKLTLLGAGAGTLRPPHTWHYWISVPPFPFPSSSGAMTTAAATLSPGSKLSSRTPWAFRPDSRMVVESMRMILP
jgi:hypothetical protein